MRYADFDSVVGAVRATFDKEIGPYKRRKSSVMYEQWVVAAGGRIKGGFAASAATAASSAAADPASAAPRGVVEAYAPGDGDDDDVAVAAAAYEQVGEVAPLRLVKRSNAEQMTKLFALLKRSPAAIHWYLEQFVFPEFMRHQKVSRSAYGRYDGYSQL